ncbi:hypothetical protein [Iningainema tapete]|uniref:Uncharacterized protein n=1 Tax=Iningainema tapete BLCC-T55 TaxID=2748662 RepID=A0A8J6XHS8_9CYAN|nr:hypothetical protein [Iningainema tapete]MBD2774578.1 hypothetical protein [Iningainema tapete BLCC-T55]
MPLIGKKIRIASAVFWLSVGVPLWLITETITPQIVQAYTARVDLLIDRLPEENYETMLLRAEAAARAATQRSFDQDILVTDVSIIVSVQSYGAIAPVIELGVTRAQWRKRPDPQRWATYFKTAQTLLFFGQNSLTSVQTPQRSVSTPNPTPQPNNVSTPNPTLQPNNVLPVPPPPPLSPTAK